MSEKVSRIARRTINDAAKVAAFQTAEAIAPDVRAALQNEALTRQRVERLEQRVASQGMILEVFYRMDRWQRVKWLWHGFKT